MIIFFSFVIFIKYQFNHNKVGVNNMRIIILDNNEIDDYESIKMEKPIWQQEIEMAEEIKDNEIKRLSLTRLDQYKMILAEKRKQRQILRNKEIARL